MIAFQFYRKIALTLCLSFGFSQAYSLPNSAADFSNGSANGVAAIFSSVTSYSGAATETINKTYFRFYASSDCTGTARGSPTQYTVTAPGYIFNNGARVVYNSVSAWKQAVADGIADSSSAGVTPVNSMNFMFCDTNIPARCTNSGSLKCFQETCTASGGGNGECVSATSYTTAMN